MKIKWITYRRKFNLGDYENEDIELEALLFDGEDIDAAFKELKKKVEDMNRGEWFTYNYKLT